MAYITDKKTIFFVTSPRSPEKMIDEIKFLVENFSDKKWNTETQKYFYLALTQQAFFGGSPLGEADFKARDRINRGPKSLGLVDLKPLIRLTQAGEKYVYGKRPEEIFLRQLLKFQFPSPYHIDSKNAFNIKPYLEVMRLIRDLGSLSKVEIALFVIRMTHFEKYEFIKDKILKFRLETKELRQKKISYKTFVFNSFISELEDLYSDEIESDNVATRQSKDATLAKFIATKRRNHLDYADAAIRYLRATGLFTLDPRSFKIKPLPEKTSDIDYILKNVPSKVDNYENEEEYEKYLFNSNFPVLLTDDKESLIAKILSKSKHAKTDLLERDVEDLKDIYEDILSQGIDQIIASEKKKLKTYQEYDDIISTFEEIEKKAIADPPLFFEWNIWRAFAMLNDGDISGNFKIDDDGIPLYTAAGNKPDIVCQYDNFESIIEVTTASGHKQYEMEGEPVARHYGDHKKTTDKEVYCIFIAPQVSQATIAYYYMLYRVKIEKYGGKAKIIPISLPDFKQMLSNAHEANKKPNSSDLKRLWDEIAGMAVNSGDENSEMDWFALVSSKVRNAFRE